MPLSEKEDIGGTAWTVVWETTKKKWGDRSNNHSGHHLALVALASKKHVYIYGHVKWPIFRQPYFRGNSMPQLLREKKNTDRCLTFLEGNLLCLHSATFLPFKLHQASVLNTIWLHVIFSVLILKQSTKVFSLFYKSQNLSGDGGKKKTQVPGQQSKRCLYKHHSD